MSDAYRKLKPAHAEIQSSSVVTCTVTAAASLLTFRRETPHSLRNCSVELSGVYTVLLLDGQSESNVPEGPTIVVVDTVRDDDCVVGVADCVEDSDCDETNVTEFAGAIAIVVVLVLVLVLELELATGKLLKLLLLLRLAPTPPPTAAPITTTIATPISIQKTCFDNPHILSVRLDFDCAPSASPYTGVGKSCVVACTAILSEDNCSGVVQAFCGPPKEYLGSSSATTT